MIQIAFRSLFLYCGKWIAVELKRRRFSNEMMLAWIKEQAGSEGGKEYDLRMKFSVCISPIFFFASL